MIQSLWLKLRTWVVDGEEVRQLVSHVQVLHLLLVDAVAGQLLQEGRHQDQELWIPPVEQRHLEKFPYFTRVRVIFPFFF